MGPRKVKLDTYRKRSVVWSFFTDIDEGSVQCVLCNRYLHKKEHGSTTPMLRHLRLKHPTQVYRGMEGDHGAAASHDHQHMEIDDEQIISGMPSWLFPVICLFHPWLLVICFVVWKLCSYLSNTTCCLCGWIHAQFLNGDFKWSPPRLSFRPHFAFRCHSAEVHFSANETCFIRSCCRLAKSWFWM